MAADEKIDLDKKPWLGPAFEPFKDWLVDGPAGKWPLRWRSDRNLEFSISESEKMIVARNVALLTRDDNGKVWEGHVRDFENAISKLPARVREKARAAFKIRFDWHQFSDGDTSFSAARFPCSVSFIKANFGNGLVSFSETNFGNGDVRFDGVDFGQGEVRFNGASFGKGDVSFLRAKFNRGNVSFSEVRFGEGDVSFEWAIFGDGDVSFEWAVFGDGDVSFANTEFGKGKVSFAESRFGEGNVWFEAASSSDGDVLLHFATLPSNNIGTSRMKVGGSLYVKSHFKKQTDFSQLTVGGIASFADCIFDQVPDFTDAKFDRPPEVSNMVVPNPKLAHTGERKGMSFLSRAFFKTAVDENDVRKFRKLKAMALAANDHEKDGEFFAKEMLAKRGTETTGFFWLLFNTLYWRLSNFGQSFSSPFLWLMGSFAIFGMVCWVKIGEALGFGDRLWFAADFSFRNMLPLLGTLFNSAVGPEEYKSWYQTTYDTLGAAGVDVDGLISLGVIQNIFGGVLLFLFLLALRNRFRLK